MSLLVSFFVGFVFSIGLVISGMTNPNKVIGFLDIFGIWDASLVFVMGGAVLFNLVSFFIILKKSKPIFTKSFFLPLSKSVDGKLIVGSSLFGIGWGIAGICPGPAFANIALVGPKVFTFLGFMVLGMLLVKIYENNNRF
jgi:uncharacterized membrane protein YedE/YeeE